MASKGNNKNAYTVLVEKPLVRPSGKRVNITVDLRAKTPISLSQDRDKWRAPVKAIMNSGAPQKAENFLTT